MNHIVGFLIVSTVALSLLVSAGPTLVGLAHAAVPLIIAIGSVAALLRVIWHFTNRY